MKKQKGTMSRKEFLKTSSVALLGFGVLGVGCKNQAQENQSGLVKLGKTGKKSHLLDSELPELWNPPLSMPR